VIRLRGLGHHYGVGRPALDGLDLDVAEGRTLGLVGRNGSGKTTLLALLAGLLRPAAGELVVGDAAEPGDLRRMVGLVLQEVELQVVGATVGEDLCLGLAHGDMAGEALARTLADRFGLLERWDEPVQRLSYGQKRKLCLAATLRVGPRVLLLDEPFAGLDYPGIREMRAILRDNRARGLTQIVAAHDLEPMADLVDQWAVLSAGRLLAAGAAEEVFPRLLDNGVRPPCAWLAARGLSAWT